MTDRLQTIIEEHRPGCVRARVVVLDDRIVIDDYCPEQPHVLWYCDNCDGGFPVTAQFATNKKRTKFITLCEGCLRKALDGIAASLAAPVTSEQFGEGEA